ncbi:Protein of unknown function [Gryllus bimaculatus]|nr:Protein of unknown function [Gryllus bimaculatus]
MLRAPSSPPPAATATAAATAAWCRPGRARVRVNAAAAAPHRLKCGTNIWRAPRLAKQPPRKLTEKVLHGHCRVEFNYYKKESVSSKR